MASEISTLSQVNQEVTVEYSQRLRNMSNWELDICFFGCIENHQKFKEKSVVFSIFIYVLYTVDCFLLVTS
jgi:hypothetical protein